MDDDSRIKRRRLVSVTAAAAPTGYHQTDGSGAPARAGVQEEEDVQPLLPGLPDHLAQLCLSGLPPHYLFSVCRSWRRLLYSPSFPPFLSLYALLCPDAGAGGADDADDEPVSFQTFDPVSAKWSLLPRPPQPRGRFLLSHPSFISRSLPVQSVAAADHLVVLAATTHRLRPAISRPLAFHPASARWRLGPPLHAPRRWCVAGAAVDAVYVASGIGADYRTDIAHSAERWNPASSAGWERVAPLGNGRFSREAAEAVASRGKLCAVNVRGRAAKEGVVYDVRSDKWEDMPAGMLAGWMGPAASAEDGTVYVVGEGSGALKAYDWKTDRWYVVATSERLREPSQMAVGGGRVCVVCAGGSEVVVVDVAGMPATRPTETRMWVVKPPKGKRALAVHVLPRMSKSEPFDL